MGDVHEVVVHDVRKVIRGKPVRLHQHGILAAGLVFIEALDQGEMTASRAAHDVGVLRPS